MAINKKYNRIKAELAEADKMNQDLAEFMGVHTTTVSDWCTNTNQPSIQDLFRIAVFLNVDVRVLLVSTKTEQLSKAAESTQQYVLKKTTKKSKKK